MLALAAIALAFAACSADAGGFDVAAEDARQSSRRPVSPDEAPFAPGPTLRRSARVSLYAPNSYVVTASVTSADGAVYLGGTFVGTVVVGTDSLTSRGSTDAFVAKSDARGEIEWARAAGGADAESAVRVDLDDARGDVLLTGLSLGEVDCGAGELPAWPPASIFLCVYRKRDGAFVAGGTFPKADAATSR